MAYARKDYSGTRASTTLSAGIDASVTSISITSSTGWPAGTNGSFYAVIDPDTASEEKVLITSRTGTTLNTVTRGVDGSSAAAHSIGATIYPCFSATDADEANYAVAQTVGKIAAAGDLLVGSAANTLAKLAKGSNSTLLTTSSGGSVAWGTVTSAMITDGTIATGDIADSQVTNAKLAGMTRGTVKVGNSSGIASDLAIGASGYVLTSDGTDAAWAEATGIWTTIVKQSNESVTSSDTKQADNELGFTATSGVAYWLEMAIVYASPVGGTTPDMALNFGEDSTGRGYMDVTYINSGDTGATATLQLLNAGGTHISAGTATTKRVVTGRGWYVGAGGTASVVWAQDTSDANATTVYAGSILRYRALT